MMAVCDVTPADRSLRYRVYVAVRCRMTALACLSMLVPAGCSPREIRSAKPMTPTMERLLAIGSAYRQFTVQQGRPPRGPDDIRGRLGSDDALISPQDDEPFVIFWGVDLRSVQRWATGRPVLAHERRGAGGSRHVLTIMGNVELVTDDELRSSSFPPGQKAP